MIENILLYLWLLTGLVFAFWLLWFENGYIKISDIFEEFNFPTGCLFVLLGPITPIFLIGICGIHNFYRSKVGGKISRLFANLYKFFNNICDIEFFKQKSKLVAEKTNKKV